MIYLNTYRPLVHNRAGRLAAEQHALPPFIDGSCRREPDFECAFPSISALCRVEKFAPRLHVGDTVAYLTRKGRYTDSQDASWRLTAILRVIRRFDTHRDAAAWYSTEGIQTPSNCVVDKNPPLPLDMTDAFIPSLRVWDRQYQERAQQCGVFLACRPLFLELWSPPVITNATMLGAFGRIPGTQNPPAILRKQFLRLVDAAGVSTPAMQQAM